MTKERQKARFDSRPATYEHIREVQHLLNCCITELLMRAEGHDATKLVEPELSAYDEFTPRLAASTYGSKEYKGFLEEMKPILDHHYAASRHHPEHHEHGIADMNLVDLLEMLCDWVAAAKRHKNGDVYESLEINAKRFGYGPELKQALFNTLEFLEE